jgi:hypothetical protein
LFKLQYYHPHAFLYFQAAKETGALQAAKNKLEKQVEELTWRLQLEKRIRVKFWIILFCIQAYD